MSDENEQIENNPQVENAEVVRPSSPSKRRQPQLTSSLSRGSLPKIPTVAKKKPVEDLYKEWQRAVKNSVEKKPSSAVSEVKVETVTTPQVKTR